MENATKALIIAATILIAVLILSVGIYLFLNYSELSRKNEEQRAAQELVQENIKFEKYEDTDMTIQDVLTIVNLANDYNTRKSDTPIEVKLSSINLLNMTEENLKKEIEVDREYIYRILKIEYNEDGAIELIQIRKIEKH